MNERASDSLMFHFSYVCTRNKIEQGMEWKTLEMCGCFFYKTEIRDGNALIDSLVPCSHMLMPILSLKYTMQICGAKICKDLYRC